MKKVIIIAGPTGSGKTALAERLALDINGEIINADMGQFYAPLSIGTAKPDYKKTLFKQHLFDICDGPDDYNVKKYRAAVLKKVAEIHASGKRAIIVGGSLFYIKSLFYPPQEFDIQIKDFDSSVLQKMSNQELWERLESIDADRAREIHFNDRYRLERALIIFYTTGQLPSQCTPVLEKPFDPFFIWVDVDKATLDSRIAERMNIMLDQGWIDEVEQHNSDEWYSFYTRKGLIGYRAIADWIRSGKTHYEIDVLKAFLIRSTCLYAKRQKTFWGSFCSLLLKEKNFDLLPGGLIFRFDIQEYEVQYQEILKIVS